jgi:cytochrome c oxidase assembly protein subunit 15
LDNSALLFQLATKGLLVALLAFLIVWSSKDTNKYRKLVWVTLFLTFDVIMFGAFTRLTDSGLGCPDWPGCYGHSNPLQAMTHIREAEAAMPNGPVTVMKAWIEMIHRYLAMGIGVLIVAIVAISWRFWLRSARTDTRFSPRFPLLLFGFVCLQGAFGAWTVTMKLQPIIVTIHLLLGMTLLALLTWLGARQKDHAPVASAALALRVPATVALVLLALQIALGGWVSTNYAALACLDFPLCHGALVPSMDFHHGFTLWRKLGMTADGEYLPFDALTAIHWTHRSFAFVVAAVIVWMALKACKVEGLKPTARALLGAIVLQIAIGIATVSLKWPLVLAVAHNGTAALLLLLTVMVNYKTRIPAHSLANHERKDKSFCSMNVANDDA